MSAGNLFSLKDQAPTAEEQARFHAEADKALADAEYEFYALQADLQAAFEVPLRDRAISAAPAVDEADAPRPAMSLAARLAAAAA